MRNSIDAIVATADELGFPDLKQFREMAIMVLMGLSVTDAPAPICYQVEIRFFTIFQLLHQEGLIVRTEDAAKYGTMLGQKTYKLTEAGERIVDEHMHLVRKVH
jgi:hypothetical protein